MCPAMTASPLINLSSLLDDAKCFALIRRHRWPEGARCLRCGGGSVARDGHDETQPDRQRYRCKGCGARFDDLTGTALAGHHQPLRVWVVCLCFMGLNLSNRQIAGELGLNEDDVQKMTTHLREGLTNGMTEEPLTGVVEIDEVYVVAGHKGHPAAVQKKAASGAAAGSGANADAAPWRRRSHRSSA